MSGHSHWHNIKFKKELTDKKRGKTLSKVSRLITVAVKEKGADPEMNPKLKLAIERAKEVNVPKDNIEKAIQRGLGKTEGSQMEEILYEAYGPAGVALIIEGITDNKNRTIAEVRHILTKFGGKLAESGSVRYMFDKKGAEWLPKYPLEVSDDKTKKQLENLFEALDENDDIQEIYSNLKNF